VETRGGVCEDMIMADGGADMPLNEFDEESATRGESWLLLDDEIEPGRRSSVIACAIRSRLPNAGISSSLRRLASSSSRRSPDISCSGYQLPIIITRVP
jgi:hypothetical protein